MSCEQRYKDARNRAYIPSSTKSRVKCHQYGNGEMGMIMLGFAAEALSENHYKEVPCDLDLLSTERLAMEKGLVRLPKSFSGAQTEVLTVKKVSYEAEGCASSAGDTESITDRTNTTDEENSFQQTFLTDTILENVFCFIRWQDILRIRGVSKQFLQQSLSFVFFSRLPRHRTPALFLPCREYFQASEAVVEAELSPNRGQWMCNACGLLNPTSAVCGNTYCCSPRSSSASRGYRMFLGQLRRDATVPMVKWLINSVFQLYDSLISVENHRNKLTGRGKGCAWVNLITENAGLKLIDYHHRIFFDTVCGFEGVWMVPQGYEKEIAEYASHQSSLPERPKYMPRNTLVVEKPASAGQTEIYKAAPVSPQKDKRRVNFPPPYDASRPMASLHKGHIKQGRWHHDPYRPIGIHPIHYY